MIEYKLNPDKSLIDWNHIASLFDKVGWDDRDPVEIEKSFDKSSYRFFIFNDGIVIGFGRSVDDGRYYANIVDVIVDPDFQGQRFGQKIVEALTNELKDYNFVTLTAAPGKHGFYKKIGWRKQSSAFIFPLTKNQIRRHCEDEEEEPQ
ncbi:MAG TPA: GNAT family N-acetyltransferase [Ignavibacteria bacterium]|nr:GNAT family N-acetyltransferase [Ignavibacteria bacterium]